MQQAVDNLLEAARAVVREKQLKKPAAAIERGMQKIFRRQGKLVLTAFAKFKSRFSEALSENEVYRILEGMGATEEDMHRLIRAGTQEAYAAGIGAASDLGHAITFNLAHPAASAWLEAHAAEMVTAINETTRDTIANLVRSGLDEGWSYNKIARAISEQYEEFAIGKPQAHIDSRAHLVAITETGNAYEQGHRDGLEPLFKQGLEVEKSWNTMGDGSVSEGCNENEAAGWIPFDDAFPSGDMEPLRFPGCRCYCTYRVAGSETEEEVA